MAARRALIIPPPNRKQFDAGGIKSPATGHKQCCSASCKWVNDATAVDLAPIKHVVYKRRREAFLVLEPSEAGFVFVGLKTDEGSFEVVVDLELRGEVTFEAGGGRLNQIDAAEFRLLLKFRKHRCQRAPIRNTPLYRKMAGADEGLTSG